MALWHIMRLLSMPIIAAVVAMTVAEKCATADEDTRTPRLGAYYQVDENLKDFLAYQHSFQVDGTASSFADFLRGMAGAQAKLGSNVTCADCYKIHQGAAGDCSSVFGCSSALCSFCTNPITCPDCWKINKGVPGSCCAVYGCDSKRCSFCTNPDSSPASCPTPTPAPPGPPSSCPGGSLKACIPLCPSNPCAAYQACAESCLSRC